MNAVPLHVNPISAMLARRRPLLMGIVNVTPDSFHDGGRHATAAAAIAHANRLIDEGADIIDLEVNQRALAHRRCPLKKNWRASRRFWRRCVRRVCLFQSIPVSPL